MATPRKTKGAAGAGASAMAAMMAASPVAARAWMDIFNEGTRFMADRLQQNLETQKAMLACRSPSDVLQVQSSFVSGAMEQYADEARRLFTMMSDAAGTTIRDARTGHSRRYDDVPL